MSWLRSFLAFVADFIVGDDPSIAVSVVAGLADTAGTVDLGAPGWLLLPLVVFAVLAASVLRELRR